MKELKLGDLCEQMPHLVDGIADANEIIIARGRHPAARSVAVDWTVVSFPDRSELRTQLPPANEGVTDALRALRDAESL